jgi:hypothetical protein
MGQRPMKHWLYYNISSGETISPDGNIIDSREPAWP